MAITTSANDADGESPATLESRPVINDKLLSYVDARVIVMAVA